MAPLPTHTDSVHESPAPHLPVPPVLPVPGPLDSGTPTQRRLVAVAEVLLCSSLPTQILLQAILMQAGMQPLREGGGFSLSFVLISQLADAALLIVMMTVLTRAHGESVSELWLGRRPVVREALLGMALIPGVFVLVVVLLNATRMLAPWLHNVQSNPLEAMARGGPMEAVAFGVVAIVAGGVREELQRAFLLRRFEQHLGGPITGVVVLSVAFGLGHGIQGWDAAITTGALGAFWAIVYLRRRSSIAPLVSHAGFNSLEVMRVAISGA